MLKAAQHSEDVEDLSIAQDRLACLVLVQKEENDNKIRRRRRDKLVLQSLSRMTGFAYSTYKRGIKGNILNLINKCMFSVFR